MTARAQSAPRELIWAEITSEDVLTGELDPDQPSRLGRYPDCPGLHADLHVSADTTGRIMLRVPESVAPTPKQFACLEDVDEVWEPVIDAEEVLVGGRGILRYHVLRLPGNQMFLEITTDEKPFGCCA